MTKIYIVLYNDNPSSEGYKNVDDAISFIENRSDKPKHKSGWVWRNEMDDSYKIKEIKIN